MFPLPNIKVTFLLLLGGASILGAQPVTYTLSERHAKKQITFESKAPLEYIEGTAERVDGTVTLDTSQPSLVLGGFITVPVQSMVTGNNQRDDHLTSADWLNATAFQSIRFTLSPSMSGDVVKKSNTKWFVKASGQFLMKGISKPLTVPVTLSIDKEGTGEKLLVEGRFTLKLSDYGIKGPAAIRMIGVRVSDTVNVSLKLVGVADKGWGELKKTPRRPLR